MVLDLLQGPLPISKVEGIDEIGLQAPQGGVILQGLPNCVANSLTAAPHPHAQLVRREQGSCPLLELHSTQLPYQAPEEITHGYWANSSVLLAGQVC